MLSEQFPWRQKAAERRCSFADATIAIVFVAIDSGLASSGTETAAPSNSASRFKLLGSKMDKRGALAPPNQITSVVILIWPDRRPKIRRQP
jgi:hypothetical protein